MRCLNTVNQNKKKSKTNMVTEVIITKCLRREKELGTVIRLNSYIEINHICYHITIQLY
jgi:hypothetical protein